MLRESSAAARTKASGTHKGLAALRGFLDSTLIDVSEAKRRRGCLLVNSVIELEGVEPGLHRTANRYLQALEQRCLDYLDEARAAGEIREDLETTQLAALTATLLQGLRVDSRMGRSRESLRQRVDAFLSLISNETKG